MHLLTLFILIFLLVICYQDIRFRAVYWICFPILAITMLILKQDLAGWRTAFIEGAAGLTFFSIQLLVLWGYLSLKNKRFVDITSDYLGLGDILFLLAIALYLSPANYILFYITSLVLVLLYTIINRSIQKEVNPEIPLAGLQALFLSIILIISVINPSLKPYNDSWIYGL